MSVMRFLRAVLGNTKEQAEAPMEAEPALTLQEVALVVTEALNRRDEEAAKSRAAAAAEQKPEPAKLMRCSCGATGMCVDLIHSGLRHEGGRMVRVEWGAVVTCPRCGRRFAVDERGQYDPHQESWPSSWIVREKVAQEDLERKARLAQRPGATSGRQRRNPLADMRTPPD